MYKILLLFSMLIPLENKTSAWLNLGSGFNLTTIFTVLLIVAWFAKKRDSRSFFIKNPLNLPVALFLIFTYLSFFTGFMKLGISFFGNEFRSFKVILTIFILYFYVANNVQDKNRIKTLIKVMSAVVLFVALIDIKEFREADIWHYKEDSRVFILGMQPNMLGSFFAQFIPIFASFAFISKSFKTKLLNIVLFSISLPALMFTYSRGAYLAIAGALIVMGILGGKKSFKGLFVLLFIAILAQSILFGQGRIIPVSVKERIDSVKKEDTSIDLRKEVWKLAENYIQQSPIFGYGYGSSDQLLYLENRDLQLDTHNMYLDIALESGIPTLLIFIWFLIRALKTAFKLYKTTTDDFYKAICLGFMGSVTALAIGNYFGTRLLLLAANGYFAILMGFVARIYAEQNTLKKIKVKVN